MTAALSAAPTTFNTGYGAAEEHRMTSTSRDSRPRVVSMAVVTAARTGDDAALGHLGSAAFRRLIAFFRYSGLEGHEAEDLAAETVAIMIGTLHRLRSDASFEAWMWAIGRNQLRGWLRRKMRGELLEPITPEAQGPEDMVLIDEEHEGIRRALSKLSQRDRQLLWLREVEGLSYDEIGGRLGAATGTVRVACHRARRRLEKAFRGENDEREGRA
jgi:RNA polymerase sigma factor (sigma-70 family)